MRNSAFVLLAGVLFIGMGAAHANEDHHKRERQFRLECKYIGAGVIPGKKGGAIIPHECTAEVRFCRRDREDFLRATGLNANNLSAAEDRDDDEDCRDGDRDRARMKIACDGKFIFRDRAFREEFAGYEYIFGIPNQLPVIKVPLDQFNFGGNDGGNHDRDHTHVVNSWLNIGPDILDGFCAVKERRGEHHEHEEGPRPPEGPAPH